MRDLIELKRRLLAPEEMGCDQSVLPMCKICRSQNRLLSEAVRLAIRTIKLFASEINHAIRRRPSRNF
jgi:hypothetical protein